MIIRSSIFQSIIPRLRIEVLKLTPELSIVVSGSLDIILTWIFRRPTGSTLTFMPLIMQPRGHIVYYDP